MSMGWIIFIVVIIVGVFINNEVLLSKVKVSDELLKKIQEKKEKEEQEKERQAAEKKKPD